MDESDRENPGFFVCEVNGERVTPDMLLPRAIKRWTSLTKNRVLQAIECGMFSADEARARYTLTEEELTAWAARRREYGFRGLCSARVQEVDHRRVKPTDMRHARATPAPIKTLPGKPPPWKRGKNARRG